MNSATEILSYASKHKINIAVDGDQIKFEAIEGEITDEFLESAIKHKTEILTTLSEPKRWNPELASEGYVWCLDCKHFNGVNCNPSENPFRTVTKCPQAPRKCQWYGE